MFWGLKGSGMCWSLGFGVWGFWSLELLLRSRGFSGWVWNFPGFGICWSFGVSRFQGRTPGSKEFKVLAKP